MEHSGEYIALVVAVSWTITAMLSEVAVKRMGSLPMNVVRMFLSLAFLSLTMLYFTGSPLPLHADSSTWFWLTMSGVAGYVFGDFCLFNSYSIIGSRFGQLFMTLAPLAAALSGWVLLGERLELKAWVGMLLTIGGISMSVLNKGGGSATQNPSRLKLPLRGVLYGIGAGVGQGVGLVLSKIGMNCYEASIPQGSQAVVEAIPFTSTFIRAIVGAVGFMVLLWIRGEMPMLSKGIRDGKSMMFAVGATITGPFVGVALSLKAVQHANAGVASTLMALTPVLIIFPAWLIFKQKVTAVEVVGALVSVLGVAMFFI